MEATDNDWRAGALNTSTTPGSAEGDPSGPSGLDPIASRRTSFEAMGDNYDRFRPTYPDDAIAWSVGTHGTQVVDVGCGTGKLTARLSTLGHNVVGVDRSEQMLRTMTRRGLRAVRGAVEDLPFKTGSVDVVTAAQAFHWFDRSRALSELRRILRGGGQLALLWNFRDERVAWVRALSEIIGSDDAMSRTTGDPEPFKEGVRAALERASGFSSIEMREFRLEQALDKDALVGLVASRSYVAVLPEAERQELLGRVARLCTTHQDLRGTSTFVLPYRTLAYRARAI